jgi:hypothetical protein
MQVCWEREVMTNFFHGPLSPTPTFVPAGAAGHAGAAAIFGGFGYWVYGLQVRQDAALEKALEKIRERRKQSSFNVE